MKKKIHKISGWIAGISLLGIFVMLFYGIYVLWTRNDTTMIRIELNVVISYVAWLVTIGTIYFLTD